MRVSAHVRAARHVFSSSSGPTRAPRSPKRTPRRCRTARSNAECEPRCLGSGSNNAGGAAASRRCAHRVRPARIAPAAAAAEKRGGRATRLPRGCQARARGCRAETHKLGGDDVRSGASAGSLGQPPRSCGGCGRREWTCRLTRAGCSFRRRARLFLSPLTSTMIAGAAQAERGSALQCCSWCQSRGARGAFRTTGDGSSEATQGRSFCRRLARPSGARRRGGRARAGREAAAAA